LTGGDPVDTLLHRVEIELHCVELLLTGEGAADAIVPRAFCAKSAKARNPHFPMVSGWLGWEDSNRGIAGVAHMLTATTTTADSQAH